MLNAGFPRERGTALVENGHHGRRQALQRRGNCSNAMFGVQCVPAMFGTSAGVSPGWWLWIVAFMFAAFVTPLEVHVRVIFSGETSTRCLIHVE